MAKKTVVVEYVGLEDINELVRLVNEVKKQGHYACVNFSVNYGNDVQVAVCEGGFYSSGGYDFLEYFDLSEGEEDVAALNRSIEYLEKLKDTPKGKVEVPF